MDLSKSLLYTNQPDGAEIAAKVVSIFSVSLLCVLFGLKTYNVHYKYLTYSRWLVLALYLFSWAFCTSSMLLVTTNNNNYTSCFLSILVCDIFYSGTKITIYAWLIEKVYVVSSIRQTRWKSNAYRFHVCLLLPYVGIFTLMLIFHVSEIDATGICIIGLEAIASLPLLIYDFLINFYMTVFFIRPLLKLDVGNKRGWRNSRLNEVALRTLVASLVCLIASFANVIALVLLKGRERGLVCLTCCTVDVTINVITIHWVTSQAPGRRVKETDADNSASQQRESNPDKMDENTAFHGTTQDIIDTNNNSNEVSIYGFTSNGELQTKDAKSAPFYTNKSLPFKKEASGEDETDSVSSVHESQSSRKSLTKKYTYNFTQKET